MSNYQLKYTGEEVDTALDLTLSMNIVTPQMFGAVADGVTDDTAAVQAALDNGGLIYFPAGVYKVTRQLTTTKPCKIKMFKQYPSQYWRSSASSGRYDYPVKIAEGEWDYQLEKGWDFGARIECYPSEGEQYGFLIGDGCEVDGLFLRAMNGFTGVLLKYDNAHQYGTDELGDPIMYQSYPSAMRFSHIRLDCDRHNTETTIPESMFDFYPTGKYFYIIEDVVIGQQNEFATYGFRSIVDESAVWANSVRLSNLCLTGLFDYPLHIQGSTHLLSNWIIEGLSIQTYPYSFNAFEQAREGHKAVITLKNMNNCLFSGCYVWDLYAAKYVKLFDCENLNNISCVGCSEEFVYGTKKLIGDDGQEGIETVLRDRLQEVAEDANVKTLTMSTSTLADGNNRVSLTDNHGNTVHTDIPTASLSEEQVTNGVSSWMDENASPTQQVGRNKLDTHSSDNFAGVVNSAGGLSSSPEMTTSHFIPAKTGDVIRSSHNGALRQWYQLYMFDANKNFISYVSANHIVTIEAENVAYIRICYSTRVYLDPRPDSIENSLDYFPDLKICVTINDTDVSYEPYKIEMVGGLTSYLMLSSPDGTQYTLAVADNGLVIANPVNGGEPVTPDFTLTDEDKAALVNDVLASLTTEEWVFTLEDDTTVTKEVVLK